MHDLCDAYLHHLAATGRAPTSMTTIAGRLARWRDALAAEGCRQVADVRPEDLDRILVRWQEAGRKRETLRGLRATARGFFAWLAERGKVLRDPALDLEIGAVPADVLPPAPLSEAEIAALIAAVPRRGVLDLRHRAQLELIYGCGLRLRESIDLDLDDLDLRRRTILVHGKGGHERLLPVMAGTLSALEDYLALRQELLAGPDRGYLFLGRRGRRLDACTFQQWLRRHAQKTLGRPVHPHLLRHSIAVHLLRGGADIRHIQDFLGHADLDTTKIYLRLVPGQLTEDYQKAMPELMDGVVAG